jgi:hypothetical protein
VTWFVVLLYEQEIAFVTIFGILALAGSRDRGELLLLLLLLTANGFSPGGSGTTIRQQTKYKLTTIRQHTI